MTFRSSEHCRAICGGRSDTVELVCTVGLIVPAALHWHSSLTSAAAAILAVESVVFVGVHVKYREVGPVILIITLGVLMAFVVYGRTVSRPLP